MAFQVDDRYAVGGTNRVTITVTYLDHGQDSWRLTYDAVGDPARVAGTVVKTNTDAWKQAVFALDDARLANSQPGAADFTLDCLGDGDEWVHMVDLARWGGEQATATPR
jgi:hypothetical protein